MSKPLKEISWVSSINGGVDARYARFCKLPCLNPSEKTALSVDIECQVKSALCVYREYRYAKQRKKPEKFTYRIFTNFGPKPKYFSILFYSLDR